MNTEPPQLSRLEIIDPEGRKLVYYGGMQLSYQDNDQTLKIFTDNIVKPTNTEPLIDAVEELLLLKIIKDTDGKTENYKIRQPLAWESLKHALLIAQGIK